MTMEEYPKASPLMESGSVRRKELSKSSLSLLGNGISPYQRVNREEADNPKRRGRPPKSMQNPDLVVGTGLLITSRGKHVSPGPAIHARNTSTSKMSENSYHDDNPASNSSRQVFPSTKKQKHKMVEMLGKNNFRRDPDSEYQERTSATAVEDTCVRLFEDEEEVNGGPWAHKVNAPPPKKKQKQDPLELTGRKDFLVHTGRVGLACYEKETVHARESGHNVAINSRSLLRDAVDSTSESEDFSNRYSSDEVEKDKVPREFASRGYETFSNGRKSYDDRSPGILREQHLELEKEKESPHHLASKRAEGLSDTSEKTHNRGRKKVATSDLPPDELRCIRSDGRSWRCTAYALPGGRRCQKHVLQLVAAQKKQQMNKGSAFVRVSSSKPRFQPSDFGIATEELKKREPATSNLHEKSGGKVPPTSSSQLVQRSLNVNTPSGKNDTSLERAKDLTKKELLLSNHLSPSHTGKWQTGSSPEDVPSKAEGKSCHQCDRSDKGEIILCSKCNQRRYCLCCITRWYSDLSEQEVQRACPFCRGRCLCKLCFNSKENVKEETHLNSVERLKCLQYMLAFILPCLKNLNGIQGVELELESTLRGSPVTKLVRAPVGKDDCVLCDNCGTSIVDFHRSCPDCDYDLCLTCCQELRQKGSKNIDSCPDSPAQLRRNEVPGKVLESLSGNSVPEATSESAPNGKAEVDISRVASESTVWTANEDGSIPCAPPERGCGSPFLVLKTLHRMHFIENLVKEVEASIDSYLFPVESERQACVLCNVATPENITDSSSSSCLAAQRSTANDNSIYAPRSLETGDKDMQHFQRHWTCGEPVIVKDIPISSSDASWEPMAMWRATQQFTRHSMHDELKFVTAIDCFKWQEIEVSIHDFLRGYDVGYMDQNGWPKMIKLDWPPSSIFEERLSRHCAEFISCLPFPAYTHPTKGLVNLAAKFPEGEAKPDLGPRSEISYGVAEELGVGDSVTKLQCGASDMVCVLVHATEVKLTAWQWRKAHQSRERLEAGREPNQGTAVPVKAPSHKRLTKCSKGSELALCGNSIANCYENPENSDIHVALELSDQEQLYSRIAASSVGGGPVGETARESICDASNMEEHMSDKERHENESGYASESDDSIGAVNEGAEVVAHGGAVWDVFRRQDVSKLQCYLETISKDLKHQLVCEIVHPIHDQLIFLTGDHKKRLKEEFQVEPWTFQQNVGEAVYIPAGCPFQVRNLKSCTKVTLEFVSPESLQESLRITEEYRLLPRNHHANEDKLQVKSMMVYAATQAVAEIKRLKVDKR